jgi:hypothetical protein
MLLSRFVVLAVSGLLLFEATATPSATHAVEPLGAASPPASAVPSPSVVPSPVASASPSVAPTPAPSPSPSAAPTPTPAPTATPSGSTAPPDPPGPAGSPAPASAPTDVAIGVGDVAALRTETSQTVANANGSKTTTFFTDPVFYQPSEASAWTPIKLGLTPATASARAAGIVATSADAPVTVSVANPTAAGGFLSASRRDRTIAFRRPDSVKGGSSADPTIHDGVADYTDFLPGVDLRVVPDAWGVKSFFIWKVVPAVPAISYLVDAGDLTLVARADGSIGLVDPSGTTVARIPRPYAVDSTPDVFAGGGRFTDKVSLSLGADGRTVTVSVDPTWLKTAVYPVYLDPTTSWANAGSLSYGDAHIASNYPNTNYSNYVRPDSPYEPYWVSWRLG